MEASAWVRYPFGGERKIQQPKQLKINNNCARNNISRAQEYNTTSGTWYQQKSDFISTFALAFSSEVASEMKHALLVWFAALLPLPTKPRALREP